MSSTPRRSRSATCDRGVEVGSLQKHGEFLAAVTGGEIRPAGVSGNALERRR